MINSKNFSDRLQKIMEFHALSASALADKIGVQRSSISHILSGRNKPSLEFVMKVLSSFPDVDLYWLLNGKGDFQSEQKKLIQNAEKNDFDAPKSKNKENSGDIERIVIFYKDGSFRNYEK